MLSRVSGQNSGSSENLFLLKKPFIHINGTSNISSLPNCSKYSSFRKNHKALIFHSSNSTGFISSKIKSAASGTTSTTPTTTTTTTTLTKSDQKSVDVISVEAVVIVKPTVRGFLSHLGILRGLDDIKDLLGKTLLLELVSSELDSSK